MRFQTKWEQGRYEINANRLYPPNLPENIATWCNGKVCGYGKGEGFLWIEFSNSEEVVKLQYGDWVCKGINGEFFKLDNEFIEKNFELLPMSKEDLVQKWDREQGCRCQECGEYYKVDFLVSDSLWEKIKPESAGEGAGLLCGSCICKSIEELNGFDSFRIIHTEKKEYLRFGL